MKLFAWLIVFVIFGFSTPVFAQKMKAEDILAKHLDSIGAVETRAATKNQIIVGFVSAQFISQKNLPAEGRIVMASAGEKNFIGMNLNANDYPSEKFAYNGKSASVAFVKNGVRSVLGNFVKSNDVLLTESLLGGTLSTSWALLNTTVRTPKLSFEGTKKIDGKEVYVLGYSPKGGSDLDIKMYFDKETFHHLRTEYKRTFSAGIGTKPEQSSGLSESRLKITEDFSDYKAEKNLTLPHKYKLNYSIAGQNGTTEIEWKFDFTDFVFNQNMSPNTFDIE